MTIISQLPIPSKQENHRCDILPRLTLSVWEATKTSLGWRPAPSVDVLLGGQTLGIGVRGHAGNTMATVLLKAWSSQWQEMTWKSSRKSSVSHFPVPVNEWKLIQISQTFTWLFGYCRKELPSYAEWKLQTAPKDKGNGSTLPQLGLNPCPCKESDDLAQWFFCTNCRLDQFSYITHECHRWW